MLCLNARAGIQEESKKVPQQEEKNDFLQN